MTSSSWPGRDHWTHKPDIAWMVGDQSEEEELWQERLAKWHQAALDGSRRFFKDMSGRAAGLAGYSWGLDGDIGVARSWNDTAATCVHMWLQCLPQMPPIGVYNWYFALGIVAGQRTVINDVARGEWGHFSEGAVATPPVEAEGAIQVALCRGDTTGVLEAADTLDSLIRDPDCDPQLTRMYEGVPDLARAAVGNGDPASAIRGRYDAYLEKMRRLRKAFAAESTAFLDTRSLAIAAVGLRSGIEFPDTNPYMPLGLVHRSVEDRDVVRS